MGTRNRRSKEEWKTMKTKNVHIDNVDENGFAININGKKIYAPFQKFNLFKRVRIEDLFDVSYLPGDVLHWERADIDMYIDTFQHPDKYVQIFDAYPYGENDNKIMANNDEISNNISVSGLELLKEKQLKTVKKLIKLAKELMLESDQE